MEQSLLPETQETQHYEEIGTQKVEINVPNCHSTLVEQKFKLKLPEQGLTYSTIHYTPSQRDKAFPTLKGSQDFFILYLVGPSEDLLGLNKITQLIDKARPSQELHVDSSPPCQLLVCPLTPQGCLSCYSVKTLHSNSHGQIVSRS